MPTANEELLDAVMQHQIYLLRYSQQLRNSIGRILNRSEDEVAMRIRDAMRNSNGLNTTAEWRRLEALMASIEAIRKESWQEATKYLTEELEQLAFMEPIIMDDILKTVMPVVISTVMPGSRLLRTIATSRPFEGRVLSEWASAMQADDIRRIGAAVQAGMVSGEAATDIARRVVGNGAIAGVDGVTEMTRKQMTAVVRTAVQHVANDARRTFLKENADLLEVEQFLATLDSRTTPICRAQDGKRYPPGEGPQPPLHFQCRSVRIPVIDGNVIGNRPAKPATQQMMLREFAEQNGLGKLRSRNDIPRGMKGSFDKYSRQRIRELTGQVPASETYQTWLSRQPAAFQDDILGVERGKLFRDGDLTLDKFVDMNTGRQFSLNELRALHPDAFARAARGGGGGGSTPPVSAAMQAEWEELFQPRPGTTGATIWDVADQMWRSAGSPTDTATVLKLRGEMMKKLEVDHGIKKTTSSTSLGQWMKDRLEGGAPPPLKPAPPPPTPPRPPAPKPVPPTDTGTPRLRDPLPDQNVVMDWFGLDATELKLPRLPTHNELNLNWEENQKLRTYWLKHREKPGDAKAREYVRETLLRFMIETAEEAAARTAPSPFLSMARATHRDKIGGRAFERSLHETTMRRAMDKAWDYMPDWMTNVLSDLDINNLGVRGRAYYDPSSHSLNMSTVQGSEIWIHEMFHGLDFKFRRTAGFGSRYRDSLSWKTGDYTMDRLAAEAGAEFVERDSRGKGKFRNGDGDYMLGDWMDTYEARMYPFDKKVSSEYITMAAQRYFTFVQNNNTRGLDDMRRRQPKMLALLEYMFNLGKATP